jgi:hypothetical protein
VLTRFTTAVAALVCLTAFAPAPLPPRERASNKAVLRLSQIQGTWGVTSYGFIYPGTGYQATSWIREVRFEGDNLVFVPIGGNDVTYRVTIRSGQPDALLDFYWGSEKMVAMHGIIRLRGDVLEFLYSGPPQAQARARDFDDPGTTCGKVVLRRGGQPAQ